MTTGSQGLLAAVADGGIAVGLAQHLSDPAVTEAAAIAGYDWVSIILEHAPLSMAQVHTLQLAADVRGLTTLVHVPSPHDERILPLLNLGVGGIVCSHVSSAAQVRELVTATRFPPLGERGAHGSVRAADYGARDYGEHVAGADAGVAIGIVVEDLAAIESADELLSVPGLTLAFLGLLDLAQALGVPGQFRHERVIEAIRRVVRIGGEHGVVVGMSPYGFEPDELRALGARMVFWPSTDYVVVQQALRAHAGHARIRLTAGGPGSA